MIRLLLRAGNTWPSVLLYCPAVCLCHGSHLLTVPRQCGLSKPFQLCLTSCLTAPLQCDAVARQLGNMDYRITMLHGGKSQDQREESIKVGWDKTTSV